MRRRRFSSGSIIGREGPLRALDELLADAAAAHPGVILLAGEAGVGKSRLIGALEERARASGFVVLHGESVEFGGDGFAYAPVASALRDIPSDWLADALRTGTAEARAALGALLPGVAEPAAAAGRSGPGRSAVLLVDLLGRLAEERAPVLLVLEDLHWADRASHDVVAYLTRNLRAHRIACALTVRTGEVAAGHPLRRRLAELARRPAVTQLELPPLTEPEVARQLEAIAGGPVATDLVAELHARAGGNPFLVEELFAARAGGDGAVPATLAEAVIVRVQRLDAPARRVLAVVAAAGGRIDHPVLTEAAAPDDAPAAVRAGLDAGILVRERDDRGVAFRHGLMAEVLYADLLPGERSALHRTLAEVLAAAPGAPVAQLAHHWHRAGAPAEALAASVEAGLEAAGMLAYAEALGHLERALELWDRVQPAPGTLPLDHTELLARAAEAARFAGDTERAIALGRRALAEIDANADPARAARQFERLGEAHFWDDAAALECYGKALAVLPQRPSPERARLLAAEGHALMGLRRWSEARERCESALAVAGAAAAPDAVTSALTTLGLVLAFLGEPAEGEAQLRHALAQARAPDTTARAHIHLGELLRLRGDHAGALQTMIDGAALANRAGVAAAFGRFMYVNGADDLLRLGRWDEVEARLAEAGRMELGLTTEAMHRAIAAQLHALRGDVATAREDRDRALAIVDGLPSEFVTPARTAAAVLALVEGEPAVAREHVAVALAAEGEKDPLYTPPLLVAGVRAEAELAGAARARRRPVDADEAMRRAAGLAAALDGVPLTPPGAVAHRALAQGELARARGRPAAGRWAAAAEQFDALHEPFPAAYARLRQAEDVLAAGGGRPEAARLLAAARDTAEALGAAPLSDAVATLARMARLELGMPAPLTAASGDGGAGPHGLTSRELEVLRLLAEGLTNREIASRLYITTKTVGTHVAHIFDKLDVHTRVQAAARAQQLGVPGRAT